MCEAGMCAVYPDDRSALSAGSRYILMLTWSGKTSWIALLIVRPYYSGMEWASEQRHPVGVKKGFAFRQCWLQAVIENIRPQPFVTCDDMVNATKNGVEVFENNMQHSVVICDDMAYPLKIGVMLIESNRLQPFVICDDMTRHNTVNHNRECVQQYWLCV